MTENIGYDDAAEPAPPLRGADYRAVHRLSTGADETLAEPGETCDRVPSESLPLLLAHGYIEPATPPPPPPRRRETDIVESGDQER